MRKLLVLDMSHYQTVSNLDGMMAAGIVGVIHKATQGSTYVDPKYGARRKWLKESGFAFASYHFLEHNCAAKQMQHYIATAKPEAGELVVIDYEKADCTLTDLNTAVAWLRNNAPDNPICIYGGSLLKEHLGSRKLAWLAGTSLWIAQYTSGDAPTWPAQWARYSLWQYSDGKVGGKPNSVSGVSQVDCNEFNGTEAECRAWLGQKPPTDAPKPVAAPEQPAKAKSAPALTPAANPAPSSSNRTSVFQFAYDLLLMAFGRRG
jgi:lysozyme